MPTALPLLFILLTLSVTVILAAAAASFDHVNPRHHLNFLLPSTTTTSSSPSLTIPDPFLSFAVLHRDSLSPSQLPFPLRLRSLLLRDLRRLSTLTRLLNSTPPHQLLPSDFASEVVSGLEHGSGEYFVRIGVGSPPREQFMVIDSGSDMVWVQCRPCSQCYPQSDPVFDPAFSASFSVLPCSSPLCTTCLLGRNCVYEVSYADGSSTAGSLAVETLTFGNVTVRGVTIGCGHRNRGLFVGAAGLLGLGTGPMSFVGQLGGEVGGVFSYCLVSRGAGSSGSLVFGRAAAIPAGAVWLPLLRDPRAQSFYFVGLLGLGVAGMRLPLPEDVFEAGMVMDTGTAVTRLPVEAYNAVKWAFGEATRELPRAEGMGMMDTCYNLRGYESVRVPTVSFYFAEGAVLTLPARNLMIPVDEEGTYCLALAAGGGTAIMGNVQQEGIQITVDAANGYVGFGPYTC